MEGTEVNNDFQDGLKELEGLNNNGQNGEAPKDQPKVFAGIAAESFEKALVEATGGKFKSMQELASISDIADKHAQLQKEFLGLKEKAETPAFKNDFVKKLNDMYANNAKDVEIENFIKIQKIKLDQLAPIDKIRTSTELMYPDLTKEQISAYLEEAFGASSEEGLSDAQKAKVIIESKKAEEHIKGFIADSGTTENERLQKAQVEQMQKYQQVWGKVFTDHADHFKKAAYEFKVGDKTYKVELDLPAETQKQLVPQLMAQAVHGKMAPGLQSFNNLKEFHSKMAAAIHLDKIVALAVSAAQADAKRETNKNYSGMGGRLPYGHVPKEIPQQKEEKGGAIEQGKKFFGSNRRK